MVYSHISYNSPTGAYSYYETRRTPFRAPPGSGDVLVTSRSSELTPTGEARRHRIYNYRSTDSAGPSNHKIETWLEPVPTRSSRSVRASSCSRAALSDSSRSRRSLSRSSGREHSMTRAERLLQEHIEREPRWIKSKVAAIKTDIDDFFERADQKHEDRREKDYRSTWVKNEMSSIKNDIKDFRDYVSSPRSQVKRLEDGLNVQKVEYNLAPRCADCGSRRSESVSRFQYLL